MDTHADLPVGRRRPSIDATRMHRLADAIDRDIEALAYDGIALKMSIGDDLVLDVQRGYADRASGKPIDRTTTFATMSVGKQFLNVLFLNYVERGLLSLTAPVADVLPEFGRRGKGRVTPYHLLTHTSGIMAATPPLAPGDLISNRAVFDYLCQERLETPPGERITYSYMAGHAVLAELLLEADGRYRSLTQLMNEELFRPTGMASTSLGGRVDLTERMAPIVARFDEPGLFPADVINSINPLYSIGGVEMPASTYLTTSDDLHRFATMLRRGGEIDGFRLLSPAMLNWCSNDYTGKATNTVFDYAIETRNWTSFPTGIGVGFFLRGEGPTHGPISTFASPRTICGWGAGSTCFWVDAQQDIAFSMVTSGIMADDRHVERTRRIGDMVMASLS